MAGFIRQPVLLFSSCTQSSCMRNNLRQNFVVEAESEQSMRRHDIQLPFWTDSSSIQSNDVSQIALEDTSQSAMVLRQIFADEELLERFISFAKKRFAAENILFLRDYLNIQRKNEAYHQKFYDELLVKYLDEKAVYQVNLPSDLRNSVESRFSEYFVSVKEIIKQAVEIVFKDLKVNEIFPAFIKAEKKALTKAFNDYIKHASRQDLNALYADPNYERLIKFILSVQRYEREISGKNKTAQGRKVFSFYLQRGAMLEILDQFIEKAKLRLPKKAKWKSSSQTDFTFLLEIRKDVIHYLLSFEDIVKKARAWEAATAVTNGVDGSPKLTML